MLNFDSFTKDSDLVKKILIGSLLALTGVGMIPVFGWAVEILRRNAREETPAWPGWENLGGFTLEGLKGMLLMLIWSLPMILLILGVTVGAVFVPEIFASEEDAVLTILLLNFCMMGLLFGYMLPMSLLAISAMGVLAMDSFKAALNPLNAWRILKANFNGFLMAWLLGTVASMALGSLGSLLCLVGVYPASVLSYGLMGQFSGAAYREALEKLT